MLRVVVALPRLPYPAISGGEIRVTALLERLSASARMEIFCFDEPGSAVKQAAAALHAESRWGMRMTFVARTPGIAAPPELPSLAASFHEPAMFTALCEAVGRGPCLVQLEFSQMAQYAVALAPLAPVLLTEHDAGIFTPETSYERPDPADAGRARQQAALAAAHLRAAYAACDRVITVSPADASRLRALDSSVRVSCVPTGVDTGRFAFRRLEGRVPGLVAFLGHYPHYPNEEAALRLCREVLPPLKALAPGARVRLAGSCPTPAVQALAGPDVEITGTLADVREALASARAFAAPMRLGRGIKGKILEAFALGTPVVATSLAVEALEGARHEKHLLIADTPTALARELARVLRDDDLAARLAANARSYVESCFDWKLQADALSALYADVARERGLAAA